MRELTFDVYNVSKCPFYILNIELDQSPFLDQNNRLFVHKLSSMHAHPVSDVPKPGLALKDVLLVVPYHSPDRTCVSQAEYHWLAFGQLINDVCTS